MAMAWPAVFSVFAELAQAIVRDGDGLACSSRNRYLAAAERQRVLALPQALAAARQQWQLQGGQGGLPAQAVVTSTRQRLQAAGLAVDYVELVAAHSLLPWR